MTEHEPNHISLASSQEDVVNEQSIHTDRKSSKSPQTATSTHSASECGSMEEYFETGSIIMEVEPYAHVLSSKFRGQFCDFCFHRKDNLKRCTKCKLLFFCSVKCQKRSWYLHKLECRCLQQCSPRVPSESARLMFYLITRYMLDGGDELASSESDPRLKTFNTLQSHASEYSVDAKRMEQFIQMAYTLRAFCSNQLQLPSPTILKDIFSKMCTNSYTICDEEQRNIGTGLYLSAAVFDHSCRPNVAPVFSGSQLSIRALSDVQGFSNLRVSYIDLLQPLAQRQTQLLEQYCFHCNCERCLDLQEDRMMNSIKCRSCDSGVILRDPGNVSFEICEVCAMTPDDDYLTEVSEAEHQLSEVLRRATDAQMDDQNIGSLAVSLTRELQACSQCLAQLNLQLCHAYDAVTDIAVQTKQFPQALVNAREALPAYRKYLPRNHPSTGTQLFRIGKLQHLLEQVPDAYISLQQAAESLLISHGEDHQVYLSCIEMLQVCRMEMSMTAMDRDLQPAKLLTTKSSVQNARTEEQSQ